MQTTLPVLPCDLALLSRTRRVQHFAVNPRLPFGPRPTGSVARSGCTPRPEPRFAGRTKVNRTALFVVVLMTLLILEAAAAAATPRLWSRSDGVRVTGVFVALHGTVLALKEAGGRNVFWSWTQVSARDRDFLIRECGVAAPSATAPGGAVETREQVVAARRAKVVRQAERAQTPPEGAAAAGARQGKEP
jgi:hypothetical protein